MVTRETSCPRGLKECLEEVTQFVMKLASAVLSVRSCICLRSPFKLSFNAMTASNRSIHVLTVVFSSLRSVTPAPRCIHVVLAQSARWVPLFFPRVAELWEDDIPQFPRRTLAITLARAEISMST